jgi:hypothetical protein
VFLAVKRLNTHDDDHVRGHGEAPSGVLKRD